MKAHLVSKYKRPMQAGEPAEPTVGERDALVEIHAAGVNMLDAKIRDGEFKLSLPYKAPFILGHDLAGVVTRVGSAVTRFTVGDEGSRGRATVASAPSPSASPWTRPILRLSRPTSRWPTGLRRRDRPSARGERQPGRSDAGTEAPHARNPLRRQPGHLAVARKRSRGRLP